MHYFNNIVLNEPGFMNLSVIFGTDIVAIFWVITL